jgi:SAM-dependent methyltransferase
MTNPQAAHYEAIHAAYARHYFDPTALDYRRRFIIDPLFEGVDLSGHQVAEIACGSGYNSLLLKDRWPSIKIEGFDISSAACEDYRRLTGGQCHHVDLTGHVEVDARFDVAFVIGGLHHCVQALPVVIENVFRMLRPGGLFFLYEASADFALQGLRDYWYRRDPLFDYDTERALTHDQLLLAANGSFAEIRHHYAGGPAYFLVLSSLILRLPLASKCALKLITFPMERAWNAMGHRSFHPAIGAVWRKVR